MKDAQMPSASHNSSGLFTINITGTKPSGAPLTACATMDNNPPVLLGTSGSGAPTGGVYAASLALSETRLYTVQQRDKKLLDPLLGWLDD
jgi:hypothetical protein